jgi:hypothetical protein
MLDQTRFEFIKNKHGLYASWAIWAGEGERPKDNVGDLSVLNPGINEDLLRQLNPNIMLVGLNISRGLITIPFANFHDARSQAMDFKIRYALKGSPFWGAYMTDMIKDFDQKAAGKMMSYLRGHKDFEEENIRLFREEIDDLRTNNPTIVAFGRDVYSILSRHFSSEYEIVKTPHYSNYGSKETYREEVRSILKFKFETT